MPSSKRELILNGDASTLTRALATIERNAQAQAQLIEDLLDISRMLRGELQLTLAPLDLVPLIETMLANFQPAAEAKQIDLQFQTALASVLVLGDLHRLQQVVTNLVNNVIKFTPNHGRVAIELAIVPAEPANTEPAPAAADCLAQIRVTDTGKGISPDFLPYLFDRFRQADQGTTRRKDGLGLGLAIARDLVELHNGTITVESPGVGQGATFRIRLPLLPGEDFSSEDDRAIASKGRRRINCAQPRMVLRGDRNSWETIARKASLV
jgi:signal transduction histidine kinase